MEFRCRLGTPGGEIIEGVYIADSESRLRHELEEKGLYVSSSPRATRSSCALAGSEHVATQTTISSHLTETDLLSVPSPLGDHWSLPVQGSSCSQTSFRSKGSFFGSTGA